MLYFLFLTLMQHKSVTIMGDFNLSQIRWNVLADREHLDPIHRQFMQFCTMWNLFQIVPGPTRGESELDITLSTQPERQGHISIQPPLICNDHDIVIFQVQKPMATLCDGLKRSEKCFLDANYGAMPFHLLLCN